MSYKLNLVGLLIIVSPIVTLALSPSEICNQSFKTQEGDKIYNLKFICSKDQVIKEVYDYKSNELVETQTYEFDAPLKDPIQPAESFSIESKNESYSYSSLVQQKDSEVDHSQSLHIAMMDEDVDISHPLLSPYLRRNFSESLDGIDNDNDGFIDNLYGLSFLSMDNKANSVAHIIQLKKEVSRPLSHGTHVGSLITQGLKDISLTTYTFPQEESYFKSIASYYDNVSKDLKKNKIRIMNMSLGTNLSLEGPPPVVAKNMKFYEIQKTISKKLISESSSTLFVVAAGNGTWGMGVDLDSFPHPTLPAAIDEPNLLVVGAINTDKIMESELGSYELTGFSNYGIETVDILAPGFEVPGARLGQGIVNMSGTSMATPLVVNKMVIPLLQENPSLSNNQVIEIILLSAYIPDIQNPFPVKSGGIINSQRALNVASQLKQKKISVLEAVVNELKLEGIDDESIQARLKFWKSRSLL